MRNSPTRLRRALRHAADCWRIARLSWRRRFRQTDADPLELLHIDPHHVSTRQRVRWHKLEMTGCVIEGDWDRLTVALERVFEYRLMEARVRLGIPWEEIDLERLRNECTMTSMRWPVPAAVLRQWQSRVDTLVSTLRRAGYRQQSERGIGRPTLLSTVYPQVNEITVNIGRGGELIHNSSGKHRLFAARLLGLAPIPMRVLVRHQEWQLVRDQVRRARSRADLAGTVQARLSHPDLAPLATRLD